MTSSSEEELAPLWWDKIPDKPTPEYEALTSLLYDGEPIEIAENFREQGNEAFKKGKVSFKYLVYLIKLGTSLTIPINFMKMLLYSTGKQ